MVRHVASLHGAPANHVLRRNYREKLYRQFFFSTSAMDYDSTRYGHTHDWSSFSDTDKISHKIHSRRTVLSKIELGFHLLYCISYFE